MPLRDGLEIFGEIDQRVEFGEGVAAIEGGLGFSKRGFEIAGLSGEGGSTRQVTKGPVGQLFDTLLWAAWPF